MCVRGISEEGVVRSWDAQAGFGVIDSSQTPGGVGTVFAVIQMPGYRVLRAGQRVRFGYTEIEQDGYPYQAQWVQPLD